MRDKYGLSGYISYMDANVGQWSSELFKAIKRVPSHHTLKNGLSQDKFVWNLGDGKTVLFWHDIWFGDRPLKDVYKNNC